MAKEIKKSKKNVDYNKGIEETNISEACTEYMKIFGANTNLMRHLPVIFDGLKPGARRILYTMYKLGLSYKSPYMKSASIVGKVMEYHPHGSTPIYETMVKLAQPWNNIQPTIDGSGNFGDITGNDAANERYTEARLTYYAYKCFFEEYNDNIVDTKPNYLNNKIEPEFLPAKYPNVLINNAIGIGLT